MHTAAGSNSYDLCRVSKNEELVLEYEDKLITFLEKTDTDWKVSYGVAVAVSMVLLVPQFFTLRSFPSSMVLLSAVSWSLSWQS